MNLSGGFGRFNGETTDQSGFGHIRYNYQPWPWLHPEVYSQLESDKFRLLTMRALAGAGPRFVGVQEKVFVGTSYMLEWEDETQRQFLSHRWSSYLSVYLRFSETVTLANTVYYQPRFDNFQDYRVLNAWTFGAKLSKRFVTGVQLMVRYDSDPPMSVKAADWELLNTLGWSF